jgi:uncharacterized protein
MNMSIKTPGVHVKEIPTLPPSVAQVETAIPAFIGYTVKDTYQGENLEYKPTRISSLKEFEEIYGTTPPMTFTNNTNKIVIETQNGETVLTNSITNPYNNLNHRLYYALRMFYGNGGGPCYIISSGKIEDNPSPDDDHFENALKELRKEDEPTMIVIPDIVDLDQGDYYGVYKKALQQCGELKNRVVLIDPREGDDADNDFNDIQEVFRTEIGNNHLKYGIAYFPWLKTSLNYEIDESELVIEKDGDANYRLRIPEEELEDNGETTDGRKSLYHKDGEAYNKIIKEIEQFRVILPPSSAVAGIYAFVDRTRGVWKAPANVSLSMVRSPLVKIDDDAQRDMNVHTTGKSVNAIREFSGKGILVWGARTLAGNDNEWRYVPVRRFYIMVEESVKKATERFVFEPNDANTWKKVRAMIENFLTLQWRAGALMGAIPDEAFFVKVGLGETMTAQDILEGRMIVEIGMAAVRPAEFIILRFMHKMVQS